MCPKRPDRLRVAAITCAFAAVTWAGDGVRAGGQAARPPRSLVVIPSTSHTTAVIAAAGRLPAAEMRGVRLSVVDSSNPDADDLATVAAADVVVLFNVGQLLARQLEPQVRAVRARGGSAWVVGAEYTDVERTSGFLRDERWAAYALQGGVGNWLSVLRLAAARASGRRVVVPDLERLPDEGVWEPTSGRLFEDWAAFEAEYFVHRPKARGRKWIGLPINRGQAVSGQLKVVRAIVDALEARGFNVATTVGYPADTQIARYYFDPAGRPRVEAVVALAMKFGNVPEKIVPLLERLGVPVVNAITLYGKSQADWEASPLGIPQADRSWQIASPEFAGAVAPTVVASMEARHDDATGLDYTEETPIPSRIARVADRVRALVALRTTPAADKRVALIYYNYPPGRENIGASYLNVMPESVWQIVQRLQADGYDTRGRPVDQQALFDQVMRFGVNVNAETPGALDALVRGGQAVLLPVREYRRWLERLPAGLREQMTSAWGEPEDSKIMIWRDRARVPYFVFPVLRYGNVVLTPQPTRGWDQDIKKAYHDVSIPPHHQYLAFYLWLQHGFRAHAMIHLGTHGTMEWLSGKEVGQTAADPSEAMVGDVPVFYPYIVDVIGEGLQAKRRGMAALVSHMTPPFDAAGLNPDLLKLRALLDDYTVAVQKSDSAAEAVLSDINAAAGKQGVLKDLGLATIGGAHDVELVEHYLKEIGEKQVPFGLHTFGVAPSEAQRRSTAEAVVGDDGEMSAVERAQAVTDFMALMEASATNELDALSRGLAGGYIAAGPGGDPIRRPDSLVTGRDLYGFDPSRLPTEGVWQQGQRLAGDLVAAHRARHGAYPRRLVFNLWSNETMRHEGVTEAEILALLGVRPTWDKRGRVIGVDVIPRQELGRPRVDVTVVASGLYRDALPVLMQMIDDAVTAVKGLDEPDNAIRTHTLEAQRALEAKGVAPADAARMSAVRLFTEPSGAYGTGVEAVAMASNTWKDEREVADVFFNRAGHLFGQGYWGERPGGAALAVDLFKMTLAGAEAVVHARSSNVYGTLDNDDVYQYMGATAMAVRQVNGATPETMILNLADPRAQKHEALDQFMGREMRSRYLNPAWIDAMLDEGYAGARTVMQVTDNLWGWQVTVPEAVDAAKWQEMYETYVLDKHQLGVQARFRASGNLRAYQGMVDRMLVAVNKGYWKAGQAVTDDLRRVNDAVMREAGVACTSDSCSSDEVASFAKVMDQRAQLVAGRMPAPNVGQMIARGRPGGVPPPAPPAVGAPAQIRGTPPPALPSPVRGRRLEEVRRTVNERPPLPLPWSTAAGAAMLVACGVLLGMARERYRPL